MKRITYRTLTLLAAVMFLTMILLQLTAEARVGGSRSLGSRGTRSYSAPSTTYSQPSPMRQQYAPAPRPFPQQQAPGMGGGFMRGVAGGLVGGMIGNMLFGGTAGAAGMGGMGHGGIGLFEIVLLAGGGYLVYRLLKRRSS